MTTLAPEPPASPPSVVVDKSSTNVLLAKKIALAGGIGFLAVFIPGVLSVLDEIEGGSGHPFETTFWFSLLAAAVAAAIRGILAVLPWNLVPTDALHGFGNKPTQVVVEPPAKS